KLIQYIIDASASQPTIDEAAKIPRTAGPGFYAYTVPCYVEDQHSLQPIMEQMRRGEFQVLHPAVKLEPPRSDDERRSLVIHAVGEHELVSEFIERIKE